MWFANDGHNPAVVIDIFVVGVGNVRDRDGSRTRWTRRRSCGVFDDDNHFQTSVPLALGISPTTPLSTRSSKVAWL